MSQQTEQIDDRTREVERRQQVTEGMRAILTILNSNSTLDEILVYIVEQACKLLDAPAGAIYRLNRQRLTIRASRGMYADEAGLSLPIERSIVGRAAMHRQPVAIADTAMVVQTAACQICLSDRYRGLLAVPLIVKDDVYGAIALYYHTPRSFSEEEVQLAVDLSDQTALAIENARLLTAAQSKAVLEERQRLARDLHDSVTQALYGITLYAEAAARLLSTGDATTAVDHLRELQLTAHEALQEMRLLIFELRPPVLDQEGLVAALQARLESVEGRATMETELVVEEVSQLPAPIEQALYRIAQEALNNVLRHAHAQRVRVALRQEQATVILEIHDDGIGFDPARAHEQGGMGLRGITERVAEIGGRLNVQSAPGAGTQVRVEVAV